ncbi:serine O-acetyltransferase EpsC [Desulfolutivibrio sulfoxidireducens]|uniref:serine O-acetyltransferase EpsC n=1 Tax=Desulfolutivibrio sulfoxidireducens TaxID=2773299 RepID=UPI00159D6B58|nr:serine O-acetyltransferase EpsC [Desulfolutivibrio sulfoxidireducens]QLA16694.1 serine acetyltransferase [Desulfolutivibrio sulfoxidireducens]QLA19429.1 serine acetyltransferase [Desulfolutivibrio sulfoxidireducens]
MSEGITPHATGPHATGPERGAPGDPAGAESGRGAGVRHGEDAPQTLDEVVERLCDPASYAAVSHRPLHDQPMPSVDVLREVMERLRAVLFPGYFGNSDITPESMRYHVGANLDAVSRLLADQIRRGYCFFCDRDRADNCQACEERAKNLAGRFLAALPRLRSYLAGDVLAAFEGDPAARSPGETIFCYPSITAMTHYRVAHELNHLGVELIPRIITEMAHSQTGIDIHPGAEIGRHFFIDHGTGTVIGETCVIGQNVRLYQGVTLGAKSFPKDASGAIIKGIPRHPVVEDDVTVYSGATILGRVTIGRGAVVGGNVWVTRDVPAGARVLQGRAREGVFEMGAGI